MSWIKDKFLGGAEAKASKKQAEGARVASETEAKAIKESSRVSAAAASQASYVRAAAAAAAASILAPTALKTAQLRAKAAQEATDITNQRYGNAKQMFDRQMTELAEKLGIESDLTATMYDDIMQGGTDELEQARLSSEQAITKGYGEAQGRLSEALANSDADTRELFGEAAQDLDAAFQEAGVDLIGGRDRQLSAIDQGEAGSLGAIRDRTQLGIGRMEQGAASGIGTLREGYGRARDDVIERESSMLEDITLAEKNAIQERRNAGLSAEEAIREVMGEGRARQESMRTEANANYDVYLENGKTASEMMADMDGLNGPEAQAKAYADYQSSPAIAYQLERAQRFVDSGGDLGGERLRELQRVGQGIYAQDIQQHRTNLGGTANRGIGAADSVAQINAQFAGIDASMTGQEAQGISGLRERTGGAVSDLMTQGSGRRVDVQGDVMGMLAQMGISEASTIADIQEQLGANTGAFLQQLGINEADLISGNAQQRQLAEGQLAQGLSGLKTMSGTNKANMNTALAGILGQATNQYGANMANLAVGEADAITKVQSVFGPMMAEMEAQRAGGIADIRGVNQNIQAGIGGVIAGSNTDYAKMIADALASGAITQGEIKAAGLEDAINALAMGDLAQAQALSEGILGTGAAEAGGIYSQGQVIGQGQQAYANAKAQGKLASAGAVRGTVSDIIGIASGGFKIPTWGGASSPGGGSTFYDPSASNIPMAGGTYNPTAGIGTPRPMGIGG